MNVSTDAAQRMMEIGLMAAGFGRVVDSETILRGVEAVRPDSELPLVALAVRSMTMGRNQEAIALLRSALEKKPESDTARSMMALVLRKAGLNQASQRAAQQVIDAGGDNKATALARSLLDAEQAVTD